MSKEFPRYNSHKLKKLTTSWRRPKGLHNKVRLAHRGYVGKVSIGYGKASKKPLPLITNINDLLLVKTGSNVLLSANLGTRKRVDIIKKANELKINILNVKSDYISKVELNLKQRKELKQARIKKKEQKQKEIKDKIKKEEDKKQSSSSKEANTDKDKESISDDDKKEIEKKEMDKVLTRKEGI
ncbi:MAG: eL32 family ribosomal protein [Candidatus Woesearchaeota archaeon]